MSNAITAAPLATVRRLESLGVDRDAISWFAKALHPPGQEKGSPIPDSSYTDAVVSDYRTTHVFTKDPSLPDEPWDLMMVKTPGDCVGLLAAQGAAGFDFRDPGAAASTGRVVLSIQPSTTTPTGYIVTREDPIGGGPGAQYIVDPRPWTTLEPTASALMWRKPASSLTAYLTASAVADQGTVYAAQFDRAYAPSRTELGVITAGAQLLYQEYAVTLPLDESDMLLIDPKVYTNNARAGAYVPIRLSGPDQPFVDRIYTPGAPFSPAINDQLSCYPYLGTTFTTATNQPTPDQLAVTPINACAVVSGTWVNGIPSPSTQIPIPCTTSGVTSADTGFDNLNTVVVLFRGLDPTASVTVKIVDVIEMVPNINSPFKQFVQPPAKFSSSAMALYHAVAQQTPEVYPADFNSWGKVWNVIEKVVREIWPIAKPAIVKAVSEGGMSAAAQVRGGNPQRAAQPLLAYKAPKGPTGRSAPKQKTARKPRGKKP
jgi:hypothetical protein